MNTPYPNNDTDDTNKLLEEIEVTKLFHETKRDLLTLQMIFMVIFTVECFSAIIAKGLWQHDEAYLKVPHRGEQRLDTLLAPRTPGTSSISPSS